PRCLQPAKPDNRCFRDYPQNRTWRGQPNSVEIEPKRTLVRLPSAQVVQHSQWTPEIGRKLAVPGLWSPRNYVNREDGNESSALSSIRSVRPQSDQAVRPDGPDRGQSKFRSTLEIPKPT